MANEDYNIFPDSEHLAVQILRTSTDWGAYSPSIGTKLPVDPVWTSGIVVVSRVGGTPTIKGRLDRPNIQLDVWHESKQSAQDISQLARVILHRGEGKVYATPAAVLTGVDDGIGISWIPDPINLKARYTQTLYLSVHVP